MLSTRQATSGDVGRRQMTSRTLDNVTRSRHVDSKLVGFVHYPTFLPSKQVATCGLIINFFIIGTEHTTNSTTNLDDIEISESSRYLPIFLFVSTIKVVK